MIKSRLGLHPKSWMRALLLPPMVVLVMGAMVVPSAPPQNCNADGDTQDNGCSNCVTSVSLTCSAGVAECQPCTFSYEASVTCPGGQPEGWTDSGSLECPGGKVERRFGCAATGVAWGGVVCECLSCE